MSPVPCFRICSANAWNDGILQFSSDFGDRNGNSPRSDSGCHGDDGGRCPFVQPDARIRAKLRESWEDLETKPWVPLMKLQVHQMGTNALSFSIQESSRTKAQVTIVTGGDDQSVSVCRISLDVFFKDLSSCVQVVNSSITTARNASFSAIKGVSHVSHPTACYFLTTGYAQRIALWKLVEGGGCESHIEIVEHLPVDVGDVNVLATSHQGTKVLAVVAGIGLELLLLENI